MKKLKRIENEKFFLRHRKCYSNIDRKTVLMFCLLGKKSVEWKWLEDRFHVYKFFRQLCFFHAFIIISFLLSMPLLRESFPFFSSSIYHKLHFSLYSLMFVDVYPSTHSYYQL